MRTTWQLNALLAGMALLACVPAGAQRLNDTGMTQCRDLDTGLSTDCAGSGQDGETGRDVLTPLAANGAAGFSFVKLGEQGEALPANAAQWDCVLDRTTGLTWEVKTNDGRLRDMNSRYSNYGDGRAFDASAFVAAVNAQGLCGAHDWRLPSHLELHSLMHLGVKPPGPTLDTRWFPNTPAAYFWSSTALADTLAEAWAGGTVSGHVLGGGLRANRLLVRLVRSAQPLALPVLKPKRDVVNVPGWGVSWQRCSVGQSWVAPHCVGQAQQMSWAQALAYAQAQASATGLPWRLPNVKELLSLIEPAYQQPAIQRAVFPNTPAQRFWTSTPLAGSSIDVWTVDFAFGGSDLRAQDVQLPVRLILTRP